MIFESAAKLLKGMKERKNGESVISDLLETPATGYTNMEDGLRIGLEEVDKARTRDRFGVIITDGNCSRGYNPEKFACAREVFKARPYIPATSRS